MEEIKSHQQHTVSQPWPWAVGIHVWMCRVRLSAAKALPHSWEVLNHYLPFFVPVYIQKPGDIIFLNE